MSSFQVSDNHINALVTYGARRNMMISTSNHGTLDLNKRQDCQKAAQILIDQNIRAVACDYNEHDEPYQIVFTHKNLELPAVNIVKACRCFNYQACGTDDWKETDACRIIEWIESEAIGHLAGYDAAAWSIH